ncbi:MAG: hypothetical protein Q8O56_13830 [Solirubrobacteraceae bacterium]|nr:hypothetical protein [Solirubrobacteraceae bacterium]
MTGDVSRSDILGYVLMAGRRLGVADTRAMLCGREHLDVAREIAGALALGATVGRVDPVAGQVIREAAYAAYAALHGDDEAIEGIAHDVESAALQLPEESL